MAVMLYCPGCGETTSLVVVEFLISPGDMEIQCPACGTVWRIQIGFYEYEMVEQSEIRFG